MANTTLAAYYIQWTRGDQAHYPNLDFLIGSWGDDSKNDRMLVSWVYSVSHGGLMLIDGNSRPTAKSPLCSAALSREQVISDQALLQKAKALLDAVWLGDARIEEIKARDRV
jgi:hypothetical protein